MNRERTMGVRGEEVPVGRYALAVALLTLTYALVLASFAPADLALGAVLSAALLFAVRRLFSTGNAPRAGDSVGRLVAFVPLAAATLWDILRGTWEVSLVTLHVRRAAEPGVVAVPMRDRTPTGVAVSALLTTLSPGTFLVDVDVERRVMLIHSINAADPDAVRRMHQEFYERYQRRVFP